jgi:hypothetical protein
VPSKQGKKKFSALLQNVFDGYQQQTRQYAFLPVFMEAKE